MKLFFFGETVIKFLSCLTLIHQSRRSKNFFHARHSNFLSIAKKKKNWQPCEAINFLICLSFFVQNGQTVNYLFIVFAFSKRKKRERTRSLLGLQKQSLHSLDWKLPNTYFFPITDNSYSFFSKSSLKVSVSI